MSVLDDLLARPDQQQILDGEVIPELRANGIRTNDWAPGSVTRADAYTAAKLRSLTKSQIATLTGTGFGDYVFGFIPLPNATPEQQADLLAWAPIVAKQVYNIDAIGATFTIRDITLTNSTATTYSVPAGRIMLVFPSGNRYVSTEIYTSAGNDAVIVSFRSEFPIDDDHAYADVSGTAGIQFVTSSYTGVAASNPAPTFAPVAQVGSGLGLITPTGTVAGSHSITATITNSGNVGAGTWSVSLDGGAATTGLIGTLANFGGSGCTLTPTNNGGSPAFVEGSIYYISWPGTDVTQVGRPAETPQEIGTRCRAVFPQIAFTRDAAGNALPISPTATAYQALVLAGFVEVKTCYQETSTTINNVVNVYVAGAGALLPSLVVTQVQAFLNSLGMLTDRPVVASPATQAITLAAGGVSVKSAQAAVAKATAQDRVSAYLKGIDSATPLPFGGLVDRSYILSLIRSTPGVTHVDDALTINGAVTDYQLAASTMATYSGNVATSLTWNTV